MQLVLGLWAAGAVLASALGVSSDVLAQETADEVQASARWHSGGGLESADIDQLACLLGRSPLEWLSSDFWAIASPDQVQSHLRCGADVAAETKFGETPLHFAALSNENTATVQALLQAGADPNAKTEFGDTPLHYAAVLNSNLKTIETLLQAGADPHAEDNDGSTPLQIARRLGNTAVVGFLARPPGPAKFSDLPVNPEEFAPTWRRLHESGRLRTCREGLTLSQDSFCIAAGFKFATDYSTVAARFIFIIAHLPNGSILIRDDTGDYRAAGDVDLGWVIVENQTIVHLDDNPEPDELLPADTADYPLTFRDGKATSRVLIENTPPGIDVGLPVSAFGNHEITYSLGGSDASQFAIDEQTGQIRTKQGVVYDYEEKDRYVVTVTAVSRQTTATIYVSIGVLDQSLSCNRSDDLSLRINASDERLTLRWDTLADQDRHSRVLGYETNIRRSSDSTWNDRRTVLGRNITGIVYEDLINDIEYQVRIRPLDAEGDCPWSAPIPGTPTADHAPDNSSGLIDRFRIQPIGQPDQHIRYLTEQRCRHFINGTFADATCNYQKTGSDRAEILLLFDDPSRAPCRVAFLFSSLTAGSFIDECFGAGVNVNVPFDRSFRLPPTTPSALIPQRAPRTQEEFVTYIRSTNYDLIPGLHFDSSASFGNSLLAVRYIYSAEGRHRYTFGLYSYRSTGPSSAILKYTDDATGDTYVFNLDFEASGNVRISVTDVEGNPKHWPGWINIPLIVDVPSILLPIPPSWDAAIAYEIDPINLAPDDISETEVGDFLQNIIGNDTVFITWEDYKKGHIPSGRFVLFRIKNYEKLDNNRAILTPRSILIGWPHNSSNQEGLFPSYLLLHTDWKIDLNFVDNDVANYTVTFTDRRSGMVLRTMTGTYDFKSVDSSVGSISFNEFPNEILAPDDEPQAPGRDRPGIQVAAALTSTSIRGDDLQTFLANTVNASYSPGDWLEPKDGSNQRMMVVGVGQPAAFSRPVAAPPVPSSIGFAAAVQHAFPRLHSTATHQSSRSALLRTQAAPAPQLTRLLVVCMQRDRDIPVRGSRYFSQPKAAETPVQICQRNCVLHQNSNIQQCVWRCETTAEST